MSKKSKKSRTPNVQRVSTEPTGSRDAGGRRKSYREQKRRRSQLWLVVAAGVVVVAMAALILLNNRSQAAGTPPESTVLPSELVNRATKGNPEAAVVVTEFSDFECPACKSFVEGAAKQLDEEYVKTGKILFEYKHYPLPQYEPGSSWAANAAECAADQGKFWEMHDYLFQEQRKQGPNTFTQARLRNMAEALGLDTGQFDSCFSRQDHAQTIRDNVAEARQLAVTGTPTIFVNGQRVASPSYAQIKAAIDAQVGQ